MNEFYNDKELDRVILSKLPTEVANRSDNAFIKNAGLEAAKRIVLEGDTNAKVRRSYYYYSWILEASRIIKASRNNYKDAMNSINRVQLPKKADKVCKELKAKRDLCIFAFQISGGINEEMNNLSKEYEKALKKRLKDKEYIPTPQAIDPETINDLLADGVVEFMVSMNAVITSRARIRARKS